VFWLVEDLHLAGLPPHFFKRDCGVKRSNAVRVQVVHHQHDVRSFREGHVHLGFEDHSFFSTHIVEIVRRSPRQAYLFKSGDPPGGLSHFGISAMKRDSAQWWSGLVFAQPVTGILRESLAALASSFPKPYTSR
jgi:hypothetical protein